MKKYSLIIVILVAIAVSFLKLFSPGKNPEEVVVYVCLDQIFSEPILKDFEKASGIKVKAIYDIEATKTTGLTNRLIAERDSPRCDVFWNNEIARTILLKKKGILEPYFSPNREGIPDEFKDPDGYWTGFAARARVIIYNKNLIPPGEIPDSIFDLIQPEWQGKSAIASPLFGTTSTHFTALFIYLGEEKALEFFRKIKANQVVVTFGNSVVKDMVANGELFWGLTDTDDVNVAVEQGKPVGMIFPDQNSFGTLLIPNTVALIKNAPHPQNARKLIDFLLSPEVEKRLARSGSLQIPLHRGIEIPEGVPKIEDIKVMEIDYEDVAEVMEKYAPLLEEIFLN